MNILNNHKLEVAIILLLFIILSVPFPAFHSSILGKSILIALILCISYFHKVLGLFAVIALVVLYQSFPNQFHYNSPYEGFSGQLTVSTDASGNKVISGIPDSSANLATMMSSSSMPSSMPSMSSPKDIMFDISGNIDIERVQKQTTTGGTTGQEGFDLLGTEDTIRKGKQSNTISVKKETSFNPFLPFETSKYVENFLIL